MKHYTLFCFTLMSAIMIVVSSCKKNGADDNANEFSEEIRSLVPQSIIESLRSAGMTIYEGKSPPTINGIYEFKQAYCQYDSKNSSNIGIRFLDYKHRFYNQSNTDLSIQLDFKETMNNPVTDMAIGNGALLSGNKNFFTAFVKSTGATAGIAYTSLDIYSGEWSATGIKNFKIGHYLKEKGPDPQNTLIPIGTIRIFYDYDYFSDVATVY